jgi:hypothetical protein
MPNIGRNFHDNAMENHKGCQVVVHGLVGLHRVLACGPEPISAPLLSSKPAAKTLTTQICGQGQWLEHRQPE